MRNFSIIAVIALFLFGSSALADVVATNTYQVSGATLQEVADSIQQNGPQDADGNVWGGAADPVLCLQAESKTVYKEITMPECPGGFGWEATTTITVRWWIETTITLPDWPGAATACAEVQQEWQRYLDALRTHEEGHDAACEAALANANPQTTFTATVKDCQLADALMIAFETADRTMRAELYRLEALINQANGFIPLAIFPLILRH